jgi:glycosyltransferase involved in cell wall biosynthesis
MEALPVAWLEGLACGAAVVASRDGPGPEVIEHGVSGLLCDPHDPASIATELVRVLSDTALSERLGRAGRRRVEKRFSESAVVPQAEAFYRACARGP